MNRSLIVRGALVVIGIGLLVAGYAKLEDQQNQLGDQQRTLKKQQGQIDLAVGQLEGALGRIAILARQGAETHAATCQEREAIRENADEAERRIRDGLKFLEEHPEGFANIPADQIRRSLLDQKIRLRSQRKTIRALDSLICP